MKSQEKANFKKNKKSFRREQEKFDLVKETAESCKRIRLAFVKLIENGYY